MAHMITECVTDFGQSGALALACFVVIAVCPLNHRWLFMEQTAHSAGIRLSELNSREGDWFLDELCTMSGNVSQMINLLESCFEVVIDYVIPCSCDFLLRSLIKKQWI